ncbi:MAG TPA: aminoglycoside 6-adenylyltransferase, partial [Leptospiraceae bacterium]|nr:aminoglycoside 6-adenylyltransferase [Leptospiraceae bacterium]
MKDIEIFLDQTSEILSKDPRIIALCVGGSWLTKEIDSYSDLDLVIISKEDLSSSKENMVNIANRLGSLCSAFTGEHVGEPRLLICLYENPILHVDLKFVQLEDYHTRVENPTIIWEKDRIITKAIENSIAKWPLPDLQWIEDRFWVWIHYAATKLGRGEYFETIDFISFLRTNVLGPLLHMKYGSLPRGVRKLEFLLNEQDQTKLRATIPEYSFHSIKLAILTIIDIYKELQTTLFDKGIHKLPKAESISILYL